ncbi:SGNH/GDSL hydrolase family protein [Aequorivita echinoideorum]|uniref:Lipase n=1 Tax=Aequorivita echinoideorum TaxID=1549647 RepID=A0ABS5S461_9FLAO|nr:lipase [Aequorivita echinoideorum]MBT0606640.1 lipase [Aequorivita echinoideorum]
MNPLKISLYVIVVLLAMLGLTYLSGKNALADGKFQDGFSWNGSVIKYPTTATFFKDASLSKEQKKSFEGIVQNIETVVEDAVVEIPDFTKIDSTKIQRIAYPEPSAEFINKLLEQLKSPNCRIIHYGDSQLEGDRISAYLRNRLQNMYGGGGPGFIPIKQVYHQVSAVVVPSENWERYATFDPSKPKFKNRNYGAFLSASRFTPVFDSIADSLAVRNTELVKATIEISPSSKQYAKLKNYNSIGLHYGNATAPVSIKVYNSGELIKDEMLKSDGKYHCFNINTDTTPENLKIELESTESPDFYGITLDGSQGISLDNVAMRGSSGTVFASNGESFGSMYQQLQPKIVIFQFGGNAVPYLKDSLAVQNYANYMRNQMDWVRRKSPEASFIFIGPSDMATTVNGEIKSYSLLPLLDSKLKQMCTTNNVAYWSMFHAMGGENSMPFWVDQKLAGSDYTHFTPSGTKIISELFFTALHMDLTNSK